MKKLFLLIIPVLICSVILNFSVINSSSVEPVNNISISEAKDITVIIDAGHGGFDGGASTKDNVLEKDINLNISLFLDDYLKLLGFKTILTRTKDISLEDENLNSIRQRKASDIHNRMNVMINTSNSIFVSIHQNYFTDSQYYGAQVFYAPTTAENASLLAQYIQDNIVINLQPENTRLIKECGSSVYLMYHAVKPAVLVECGFLSNKAEAELLKTEKYQKAMALCIAFGIQDYLR